MDSDMDAMEDDSLDCDDLAPMSFYEDEELSGDGGVHCETMEIMDQIEQSLDSNHSNNAQRDDEHVAPVESEPEAQPTVNDQLSPCVVDVVEIDNPENLDGNSDRETLASNNTGHSQADPAPSPYETPLHTHTEAISDLQHSHEQSRYWPSADEMDESERGIVSVEDGILCITID